MKTRHPTGSTDPRIRGGTGHDIADRQRLATLAHRGLGAGGLAQALIQSMSIAATFGLARLLGDVEFGIVAAANSLLGLGVLVLGLGLAAAIVRKPKLTQDWLSSVLWISVLLSGIVTLALVGGAATLAGLFGVPEAGPYLAALAPATMLNMASAVALGILQRRLALGMYWTIHVVAMVLYVGIQLALAMAGWGAWAVIVGQLVMATVQCSLSFVAARWTPSLVFRPRLLREDIAFTGGMLGNNLLGYSIKNVDYWIVGGVLGAAALGNYYVAYVLPSVIRVRLTAIVGAVQLPVFARVQDDMRVTRVVYRESVRLLSGLAFPAMAGIAVLAEPIVTLFFGGDWLSVAGPLRWVALAAMLESAAMASGHVAIAHQRVGPLFAAQVVRLLVFVPAATIAAMVWQSTEMVAMAALVATAVWCVAQQLVVARPLGLYVGVIRRDLLGIAAATATMCLAVSRLDASLAQEGAGLRVMAGVAAGAVIYVLVGAVVARSTFVSLGRQVIEVAGLGGVHRGAGWSA